MIIIIIIIIIINIIIIIIISVDFRFVNTLFNLLQVERWRSDSITNSKKVCLKFIFMETTKLLNDSSYIQP